MECDVGDARDEKAGHQQVKEGGGRRLDDGHRDVAPDRGKGEKFRARDS
jgi:hypothetical protein